MTNYTLYCELAEQPKHRLRNYSQKEVIYHLEVLPLNKRSALKKNNMRFVTDGKRHLICIPYSISGLHVMASILNIDKCFYHFKNKKTGRIRPHYDIPALRKTEIEAKCEMMTDREITSTINQYIDSIYNKKQLFKR